MYRSKFFPNYVMLHPLDNQPYTFDVHVISGGIRTYVILTDNVSNLGGSVAENFGDIADELIENGVVPKSRVVWVERIKGKPNLYREFAVDDSYVLGYLGIPDTVQSLLRQFVH